MLYFGVGSFIWDLVDYVSRILYILPAAIECLAYDMLGFTDDRLHIIGYVLDRMSCIYNAYYRLY